MQPKFLNVSIVLFVLAAIQRIHAEQQLDFLHNNDFRLEAKVQIWRLAPFGLREYIRVSEVYSNTYKRSRVEVIPVTSSSGGHTSYYITEDSFDIVRHRTMLRQCDQIGLSEFLAGIFGSAARSKDFKAVFSPWVEPTHGVPPSAIGLVRILFILQAKRSNLIKLGEQIIRGRPSSKYSLELLWGRIEAFYSRNLADDAINWHPVQVRFKTRTKQEDELLIDFYTLEPIHNSLPFSDSDYRLHLTTIPLGVGCSAGRLGLWPYLASSFRLETFSMTTSSINPDATTETKHTERPPSEHFIAYDSRQSALRRDTIVSMPTGRGAFAHRQYLTTVYDLKKLRRYNVKFAPRDNLLDGFHGTNNKSRASARKLTQISELDSKDCVVSELSFQADLATLLPSTGAYMGRGLVRGLEVDIYESISNKLPALFFPATQIKIEPTNGTNRTKSFSTVYYFAKADRSQASREEQVHNEFRDVLVRVDIFRDGKHYKQVNVFDFVWRLTQAPNGDRQDSLFALHHSCTIAGDSSGQSYTNDDNFRAWLRLEMDYFLTVEQGKLVDNAELSVGLLENEFARNRAIRWALSSESRTLSATQLHQVRSKLLVHRPRQKLFEAELKAGVKVDVIDQKGKESKGSEKSQKNETELKIVANVEVSLPSENLFVPKLMGSGKIISSSGLVRDMTNFDDCFHEACRRRKTEHVLFAFTANGECHIDDRPIYESTQTINGTNGATQQEILFTYSNLFRLSRQQDTATLEDDVVQIMQIDLINAQQQSVSQAWQVIHADLSSLSVMLSLVTSGHLEKDASDTTTMFKLTSCDWLNMHGNYANMNPVDSGLAGVGLISGHEVTRPTISSDERPSMDQNMCRSVCLADLECQMYSVCVLGDRVECRLTQFDLKSNSLVPKVKAKLNQLKKSAKALFEIEANSESNSGEAQLVKLKFDKRCRIYEKRALDMFVASKRFNTSLHEKIVMQVDSEEDCARQCLRANVEFTKKTAKLGYVGQESAGRIRKVYRNDQRSWCATFRYIDRQSSTMASNWTRSQKLGFAITKNGLCLLPMGFTSDSLNSDNNGANSGTQKVESDNGDVVAANATLEMDMFKFAYVSLYEARKGVRLLEYPESRVGELSSIADAPSSGSDEVFKVENRRKLVGTDNVESCARACFMQTTELRPWCRSFDYIETRTSLPAGPNANTDASKSINKMGKRFCAFNSISLADAEQAGIGDKVITTQSLDANGFVYHYEPHQAYTISDFKILKTLIADGGETKLSRSQNEAPICGSVGASFIITTAIVTGLAFGAWLKRPIVDQWLLERQKRQNEGYTTRARRLSHELDEL